MAKLIDREALKEALLERGFHLAIVKYVLESAETVGAVEVVRCRECKKHCEANGKHYCKFWRMYCPDDSDFFCKAGKRKEGADNG